MSLPNHHSVLANQSALMTLKWKKSINWGASINKTEKIEWKVNILNQTFRESLHEERKFGENRKIWLWCVSNSVSLLKRTAVFCKMTLKKGYVVHSRCCELTEKGQLSRFRACFSVSRDATSGKFNIPFPLVFKLSKMIYSEARRALRIKRIS